MTFLKRLVPAVVSLVLGASAAFAQTGSIVGRVTASDTRQGLSEARVQVLQGARTVAVATTAASGEYAIRNLVPGTYSIRMTRVGYTPVSRQGVDVAAGGAATVDATLEVSAARLDAVVATASRGREEKALDAPAQIAVVDQEAVEVRVTPTLQGHIRNVPGVDVNQGGVLQSNIVTRGFNNAFSGSLLMLQDYRFAGVPSLRVNIPALVTGTNEDIERIEVLLGPASALFGPNSANGVLHVLTKSPFTSEGTTITLDGGSRSYLRGALRTAHVLTPRLGLKVSGEYMTAEDFEYTDPGEPDSISRGGVRVLNERDYGVNKFSGEARMDVRLRDDMEAITTFGLTHLGSALELTGANGTAQIRNWRYMNLQQRFSWNRLFLQAFVNSSDAGNADSTDTRGTFLLRSGQPIVDKSQVYSVQAQHGADIGDRFKFTYGADYIFTSPSTGNTINGRNEDLDDMVEYGAYVQGTTRVTSMLDFLAAVRADQHDLIEGTFISPRAALLFKPAENQNLRLTYNRAFNTPGNFSFFLDLVAARNPSGLPFNVRAMGNPPKEGWQFRRDCTGGVGNLCMRSAFIPTSLNAGPMEPAIAALGLPGLMTAQRTQLIAGISSQLQAGGLSAAQANGLATAIVDDIRTPRAQLAGVASVLRPLGSTATIDPASVVDIEPLKASFNNTYEIGYKGVLRRFAFDVATYYQKRGDVSTPATIATPSVFIVPTSLTAYTQPRIQAIMQGAGFSAAQAAAASAQIAAGLSNNFAPVPFGTVTFDNERLAPGADVIATYQRVQKEIELWGSDVAVDFAVSPEWTVIGTAGYASKVVFDDVLDQRSAPLTLNAPGTKGSLAARFARPMGWGGELRGRYSEGYPVNSGVYSSYGTFPSPNAGGAAYTYPAVESMFLVDGSLSYRFLFNGRRALWSLNVTNLLNEEKPTFPGVPAVGLMAMTRLQYTF